MDGEEFVKSSALMRGDEVVKKHLLKRAALNILKTESKEEVSAFITENMLGGYVHPQVKNVACNEMISVLLDSRYNLRLNDAMTQLCDSLDTVLKEILRIFDMASKKHGCDLSKFTLPFKTFLDISLFSKEAFIKWKDDPQTEHEIDLTKLPIFNGKELDKVLSLQDTIKTQERINSFIMSCFTGNFAFSDDPKTKDEVIKERISNVWDILEKNRSRIKEERWPYYYDKIQTYLQEGNWDGLRIHPITKTIILPIEDVKPESFTEEDSSVEDVFKSIIDKCKLTEGKCELVECKKTCP